MGLGDFLMKKSKNTVPGLSMRIIKSNENFDPSWMQDPHFRDLLACVGQLAKTELDLTRIGSRGYLKRLPFYKVTVKDKRIRELFEALKIDESRLEEDGYITTAVRSLIYAQKSAINRGGGEDATNAERAVNVCSFVLMRFIQERHPEYNERIAAIAPSIKEAVK